MCIRDSAVADCRLRRGGDSAAGSSGGKGAAEEMIFLTLFLTFFKIGVSTFGGGYAMIPMIQAEVISHGGMTHE